MEGSHKTHRPHIKVGKDEEKKKEEDYFVHESHLVLLISNNMCLIVSSVSRRQDHSTALHPSPCILPTSLQLNFSDQYEYRHATIIAENLFVHVIFPLPSIARYS